MCVLRLGDAVQRPEALSHDELLALCEAHGDVVEVRRAALPRDRIKFEWRWIPD